MTNANNGFIGGRGQFVADGGWTNQGVMAFSGTTDILGDINIEAGGEIITLGGATTTIFDGLLHNGLQIRTGEGSRTVVFGTVGGVGAYTDVGLVEFVDGFSPGSSPAEVSFGGDVVLGPSSTTLIELAGTANGEYDRLLVAGELEVSGALEVQLLDGFAPSNDTAFEILAATDLSGTFSSLVLPDLLGNLSWDSSLLYSNGTLSVIPEPATLSLLAVGMLMACRRRRRCG
jgi:hypothetical protein